MPCKGAPSCRSTGLPAREPGEIRRRVKIRFRGPRHQELRQGFGEGLAANASKPETVLCFADQILQSAAQHPDALREVRILPSTIRRVATLRRQCLTWGVHCVLSNPVERFKQAVVSAVRAARDHGFATDKDQIVVTAGVPFNVRGTTNILRVAPCDERLIFNTDPE